MSSHLCVPGDSALGEGPGQLSFPSGELALVSLWNSDIKQITLRALLLCLDKRVITQFLIKHLIIIDQ